MADVKSFTATNGITYGFSASSLQNGAIPAIMVTLTLAGWSNLTQTVTATGVTSSSNIIVAPAPSVLKVYGEAGVYCSAQGTNSLTFKCDTVPLSALTVNVLIIK